MKLMLAVAVRLAGVLAVGGLSNGCDNRGSRANQDDLVRQERQRSEKEARAKGDAWMAFRSYLEGRQRLAEETCREHARRLVEVDADAARLEKIMASISARNADQDPAFPDRLVEVLENQEVNELALKYLVRGFSLQREQLAGCLRELDEQMAKYKEAVRLCDRAFESKLSEIKEKARLDNVRREAEVKRLEKVISDLENKRKSARQSLGGGSFQEHDRLAKVQEYGVEIAQRKSQLENLRGSDDVSFAEKAACREAQMNRLAELERIDSRLKPKRTRTEVAREVSAATVDPLRLAIVEQRKMLADRVEDFDRQVRVAKELMLEIGISGGDGLRTLRERAERAFSKEGKNGRERRP